MRWLALVALALLVAGCSETATSGQQPLGELPDLLPTAYAIVCPPGAENDGPVCAGRIASLTESNQEPFAAVDPYHAGVMAIGVNAGHTTDAFTFDEVAGASVDEVRLDVFVSSDNGTTWIRRTLPPIIAPASTLEPVQTTVVGDPALVFSPDGTLHTSGIVTHSSVNGYSVFYIASHDLGATWDAPVVLSDGDNNDRNWMNRGPDGTLYVPWQRVGSLSEVAWSTDGGATWRNQQPAQKADGCITVSEVIVWNGTPTFACSGSDPAGGYNVTVYAFDPATGDLALLHEFTDLDCIWPKLAALRDVLFLTAEGCADGVDYATSPDGRTWSEPESIERIVGQTATGVMWQTGDAWGRLHIILADDGLTYRVLDGTTEMFATPLVAPATSTPSVAPPRTVAPPYGDHYYGVSLAPWGGLVVWTQDSTVRYTFIAAR
jgi:hypothetical protein